MLAVLGGYNVMVDPGVDSDVSFRLRGMTVDDALEMIIRTSGYSYRQMGNTLIVGTESSLKARFDTVESKCFHCNSQMPTVLLPVLKLLLPDVEAHADTAARALVVRGTAAELAKAEELIRERDVRPRVEHEFVETPVIDILRTLARLGGYNLVAEAGLGGAHDGRLKRSQAWKRPSTWWRTRAGLTYEIDGLDLLVRRVVEEATEVEPARAVSVSVPMERHVFRLVHVNPQTLVDAVHVLAVGGDVWADETSGTVIVSAGAGAMRQIEQSVALLDVPTVAVRGALGHGDEYVAIVHMDDNSYIVRRGDQVGHVTVVDVDADGVSIETMHGQLRGAGRGEMTMRLPEAEVPRRCAPGGWLLLVALTVIALGSSAVAADLDVHFDAASVHEGCACWPRRKALT